MVLTFQARGRSVETVEGLSGYGELDPLQRSFVDNGAIQCGYCTPGMVMSAHGLLRVDAHPSEEGIREAIAGNLCRCTGYVNIVKAIKSASKDSLFRSPSEASSSEAFSSETHSGGHQDV
jgi:carbon-monoxide dehydrogenase small subunit